MQFSISSNTLCEFLNSELNLISLCTTSELPSGLTIFLNNEEE